MRLLSLEIMSSIRLINSDKLTFSFKESVIHNLARLHSDLIY
jgi:hypothetical protein